MYEPAVVDAPPPRPAVRAAARVLWYVNRLRCMTVAEIPHRIARALTVQRQRVAPRAAPARIVAAPAWVHVPARIGARPYLEAADRICAGRFDLFALRDAPLGAPPPWNRDPKTGVAAPSVFGLRLNYRDVRVVGDIKYLWELNRQGHLVTLAQAYALSGQRHYAAAIRAHLESWFAACPYPRGPNWSSALEAALRLINWAAVWQLLGGAHGLVFTNADGARFRERWLQSIRQHALFIRANFSRYSSANNHLIGEAAGLYIAALTWPFWPDAGKWRAQAHAILEREAERQNAPDGVNREQSTSYQQFVAELLLLALLAGRANGVAFSRAYTGRIEAMLEYLASIVDVAGNVPMIGDADDAVALKLAPQAGADRWRWLLGAGALLFRRGEFKRKADPPDDRLRWLFGAGTDDAYARLDTARASLLPVRREFPLGGYYILGCGFETRDEIRLLVDAGPLGYGRLAAHGHADALAFTLSVGGREFFVDPGTYAYHADDAWRACFRSTAAHNTVLIDGVDQSRQAGNFMWLAHANAGCSAWHSTEDEDVFEGWHDGYARLREPVVHRRRIVLDKRARRFVLEDRLVMAGRHEVTLFFHCSENCVVASAPAALRISNGGRTIELRLPQIDEARIGVYCGSADPPLGWIARYYDRKEPAPTIVWQARLRGEPVLRSEIAC